MPETKETLQVLFTNGTISKLRTSSTAYRWHGKSEQLSVSLLGVKRVVPILKIKETKLHYSRWQPKLFLRRCYIDRDLSLTNHYLMNLINTIISTMMLCKSLGLNIEVQTRTQWDIIEGKLIKKIISKKKQETSSVKIMPLLWMWFSFNAHFRIFLSTTHPNLLVIWLPSLRSKRTWFEFYTQDMLKLSMIIIRFGNGILP